jgi:hypothetical protein
MTSRMSALYLSSRINSTVVRHHGQHASQPPRVTQCDLNAPLTLYPERVLRHRHVVGMAAGAAPGAAEAQILQRHVAATSIYDGLEVGRRLMAAGTAPNQHA